MSHPTVAVTGATGFVGASAVRHLQASGFNCLNLGRRVGVDSVSTRPFALGGEPDPSIFDGVDALIHCAWDMHATTSRDIYERNVVGTTALFRAARRAGVSRIVLVSSMSAYDGTRQVYGRAKLECERAVHEMGGVSLRLGLVWGAGAGGMARAVTRLASLPVVPVFGMRSHQFAVHRDDVTTAMQIAVTDTSLNGVLGVAHPDPVPIPQLFRGLAQTEGKSAGRFLPIPWTPVYWTMRTVEMLRIPLPLRSDSVLGLVRPAPVVPAVEVWRPRGLVFRTFLSESTE